MSNQRVPQTEYVVRLGVMANSFYDPECRANLFKGSPYYYFNHQPTRAILTALRGGKLVDIKGNISLEKATNGTSKAASVDMAKIEAEITAKLTGKITAEVEADIKAEMNAEIETLQVENKKLKEENDKLKKAGKKANSDKE